MEIEVMCISIVVSAFWDCLLVITGLWFCFWDNWRGLIRWERSYN